MQQVCLSITVIENTTPFPADFVTILY